MNSLRVFLKLVGVSLRSQMQYKASFWMLSATHFVSTFVDIFGIWILFDRFKVVKGWSFEELALIYGVMQMGFAAAESAGRGFDGFGLVVKNGDFDRVLLRPLSSIMQIAARDIQLMRIGRFFQGLVILVWGCSQLGIDLFSTKSAVIALSLVGTTCLFYGLFVLQATICFWTTETLELMNITTYGGLQAGQYPISIYNRYFQAFFTFVVPIGCVAYYPLATLLQKEAVPFWLGAVVAPLWGVIFLAGACFAWRLGVRRYHSTGG